MIALATTSVLLVGAGLYRDRATKAMPNLAVPGKCEYDLIYSGSRQRPPTSLAGITLGAPEQLAPVRSGQKSIASTNKGRGERSYYLQTMMEGNDSGSYVMSTVSTGDQNGRRVIAGIHALNPVIEDLPVPSFILRPKHGSNCAGDVAVYAQDQSAISATALKHAESCDYVPVDSCGPSLPIIMMATCRMRSEFPKGKALYVIGKKHNQTAFLADWSAMTEWRFDPTTYRPANRRRECPNPFSD